MHTHMHQTSIVQRKRTARRRTQRIARRVLPFLASLFLATPIAGPVNKSVAGEVKVAPRLQSANVLYGQQMQATYQALGAEAQGLKFETFERAMTGYLNLQASGKLTADKQRLTVVDFDLPSTEKRLWVIDLAANQILFHTLVAHGHNSGENQASSFSNTDESNMSSLGFYVTEGEYAGKHGRSLRLMGQDEGWNTNAAARSIVMHGADYVSEDFIKQNGRLGRSLGCPALPMAEKDAIIEAVEGGTCLFIQVPEPGKGRGPDGPCRRKGFLTGLPLIAT
jgi:L,D-transpeptidase catalytic domain